MKLKFVKMQGCGNDYVYVDCTGKDLHDEDKLAKRLSDRHFGIGSDGLILIRKSNRADFKMSMYNADGSEGKMCGNGIRCVGKYVYDHGLTAKNKLTIETLSGIKNLDLTIKNGSVVSARVDMGKPELTPEKIPVLAPEGATRVVGEVLQMDDETSGEVTCISMGNPHCVLFVEDVDELILPEIGPAFENHEVFPERVNTEFVQVLSENEIKVRVWERGSGETLACGTGACAAAVASVLNGQTGRGVKVHLPGGVLDIEYDQAKDRVYMTGPAVTVFSGEIEI
ncbi:MAG: diaminopimelate epimerase [Lachnospiraceae bacterium]|nr:diaminopimelate epimerase [Lachnospiraceae bacterium]MBQ7565403.1 diaminopimelate epimerase [Lachnospiraceae bacterium]